MTFSIGFEHPDEYFQIVEFASTKLGISATQDLPWEYREHMRSWLQPAIHVGVARAASYFGIERPFTLMALFRVVTGVVSWAALWTLVGTGRRWVESEADRCRLYALAALLWFLPYLGVRTSSETLATAALCFAIVLLEQRAGRGGRASFAFAALGGLAFGLCFEFRFPSGVMAAGAALWYLAASANRWSLLAALAIGGACAVALGAIVDRWGYGVPTFPPYSYLYQNLVLGRSEQFGTAPFFAYLYMPLKTPMAPLVLLLEALTILAWWRRPNHVLTWTTAPYVALLCALAHKEVRFVFPLAPFVPFCVVFALAAQPLRAVRGAAALRWFASGWRLGVGNVLNALGLIGAILLVKPSEFSLYRILEQQSYAANGPFDVAIVHTPEHVPYEGGVLRMTFIRPANLRWTSNPTVEALEARRSEHQPFLALIDTTAPQAASTAWIRTQCEFAWPPWPRFLRDYKFMRAAFLWELYRCGGK